MPFLPEPTPHQAVLMASPSQANLLEDAGDANVAKTQAMLMRNDKSEWTPVQQHLYSQSTLKGSTTSGAPVAGFSGFQSSHESAESAFSPSSQFDVTPDDFLFVSATYPEDDDYLHDPGVLKVETYGPDRRIVEPKSFKRGQGIVSAQGLLNLAAVSALMLGLIFIFAGLPIMSWIKEIETDPYGADGLTGPSGDISEVPAYRGLIDPDTPDSAKTMPSFLDDDVELQLVFSDEFNTDGREFYPGMDPYFEAVSLHYWQTSNLEYYYPGNVYTEGGNLVIELTKEDNDTSHGFGYFGGMLQSWNQACFQGGYVEVGVSLPGDTEVSGLWPAIWTMSNLGRAGYGGSLDGTWPYVYDQCDVGTVQNQSINGVPSFTTDEGDIYNNGDLNHLLGQTYSRCTCGDDAIHPGPRYDNGTYKGRGASEIDLFEATVDATSGTGSISQSAQWAPFNPNYSVLNKTSDLVWYNTSDVAETHKNTYVGGATQQVTSGLSTTDASTYNSTTNFAKVGAEWIPSTRNGWGTGKAAWTFDGYKAWNISDKAMAANSAAKVGNRVITDEPMYLLFNVGMSENFGYVDLDNLIFPSKMRVDYVRVYQDPAHISTTCDPDDAPTADFIAANLELYTNANFTTLADAKRTYNKNSMVDDC